MLLLLLSFLFSFLLLVSCKLLQYCKIYSHANKAKCCCYTVCYNSLSVSRVHELRKEKYMPGGKKENQKKQQQQQKQQNLYYSV